MGSPSAINAQKRRQALHVTLFLAGVVVLTAAVFYSVHEDLVAYRRGELALAENDFATAADQLGQAWERGYRTPRLRVDLARARLETGDRAGALPLYLQALAASPHDESLLDTVVGLYQAMGKPERGLALFARLGKPEQLSAPTLIRLGDLQQQIGDYPGAIASYELAAQRLPREAQAQLRLGIVLSWVGRRTEAIAALRKAIELDPKLRVAQLQLGRVLLWNGDFAEAITQFRRVLPQ